MLKFQKSLSEENIFELVSEYEIFQYYIGHTFEIGKVFSSPLRRDINPSFNIFASNRGSHSLMFKDYATGESGNCFAFVCRVFDLNYYQALVKVNDDLDLDLNVRLLEYLDYRTRERKTLDVVSSYAPNLQKSKAGVILEPVFRDWHVVDDHYWFKKYGLTREQLEYYNIKPCESVTVNEKYTFSYKASNPIYCYGYKDWNTGEYVIKVYRPLEKDKKYKWLSNLSKCSHMVIEGYDQLVGLPKKKSGFITKSTKDVACLRSLGFHAVALKSESEKMTDEFLQATDPFFDEKILLFDNDEHGIARAQQISKEFGLKYNFYPRKFGVKDTADTLERYKANTTKEIIQDLRKTSLLHR